MPTDDKSTLPEQTEQSPPAQPLTEDAVKAHPLYKELEEKHSAARQGMDKANLKLKETKEPEKPAEDETLWYVENAKDLKLAKDEYQKELDELLAMGAKPTLAVRQKALSLAKQAKGLTPSVENIRQTATASAPATVDRSGSVTTDVELTETDKRLGVKPETKQKWRHLVEGE